MLRINKINILGVNVSALTIPLTVEQIQAWINNREPHYICVSGAHGILKCYHDEQLRHIHNQAGLVTPDGMSLVFISHWLGQPQVERVYGPDLMQAVCEKSRKVGWRNYLYGAGPGVAELLGQRLRENYPGLIIAGTSTPPYRTLSEEEDRLEIELINSTHPDIVWVGLSTPKQERWMAAHQGKIDAPVLIGVGAAFDFLSGTKRQAPRWIQRSGFEWLFRLANEPRRLWRRYAEYPLFVLLILLQLLRIKHFPTD